MVLKTFGIRGVFLVLLEQKRYKFETSICDNLFILKKTMGFFYALIYVSELIDMKNKGFCSAVLIIVLIFSLTGCSLETERDLVRVPENTYQETGRAMSYVQRGDVAIGIEEELQLKNYKETKYGFVATRMDASLDEDLVFDQLYVNVGDTVKKGELLLKLRSEHLDNDIEKYTEQKEKAQIRLNHLRNRSAIDENEDNSYEINNCLDEIQVAEGYLQELEEERAALSIYAKEDGEVIYVSDSALSGLLTNTKHLVTIGSGDDTYYVETKNTVTLKEGDLASVTNAVVKYDARVEKIERSSDGTSITFKLVNTGQDRTIVRGLKAVVAEEVRKDVLYVTERCIKEKDGRYFAFMLDEHGARIAKEVHTDGVLGGYVIIKDGLNEGDEVIQN